MKSGKQRSRSVPRLALTSAAAGAALLGCATPAIADQSAADLSSMQSEGTERSKNPKLSAARQRLDKAEANLSKAQQDLDTALKEKARADSVKDQTARIQAKKQSAYDQAMNIPVFIEARDKVRTATNEREQAQSAFDQAQQEVTRLENMVSDSGATIAELTDARDEAQAVLDEAKLITASKQAVADEANRLRVQGSAGYFEYKGATGAYKILTDSEYSGKTYDSIHLGQTGDATSMDKLLQTMQWLDEANRIRVADGKRELLVSDTMMAMSQAHADWSRDNDNAHALVFPVGENLAWTTWTERYDPFYYWYTEEKQNKATGIGETHHYENIINDDYAFTGFAISNTPNGVTTMIQTFQFTAPSAVRSIDPSLYWAGNHNSSTAAYFQDVNNYLNFLDNAQTELTSAQSAEAAAQADLDAKQGALPALSSDLTAARTARDLARTNLDTAGTNLTNAQATLAAAQAVVDADPDVITALQALNEANDNLNKATRAATLADTNLAAARRTLADALAERTAAHQELSAAIASGGLGVGYRPFNGVITGEPESLALTGSDSLIAAAAAASLCATAMGALAIRRKALL